jgi:radical SAM superfamily enzyme YgiQ (UPF0313 family)
MMSNNKKLLLILPKRRNSSELLDLKYMAKILGKRRYGNPPLSLPTIAALTPQNFEIHIIDEHIEEINFDEKADLVGITCMTPLAIRAYEIADEFRKRGAKVVLGGIHPTMLPNEAAEKADSIILGEAEYTWPILIQDFLQGSLKKFYHSERKVDLKDCPVPRCDLLRNEFYITHTMQISRGCPHKCEFCSNVAFYGNQFRFKPIENVTREIESLIKIDKHKTIFICDDNITANKRYAKELFKRLIPYKITWSSEASIDATYDDELLDLMAESGAKQIFVGFETLSQDNLKQANKSSGINKVEEYKDAIEKIQSRGIAVIGGFILGLDHDDETSFEKIVDFIEETNMAFPHIRILQIYPGTPLFDRMLREKRIINNNWEDWSTDKATFMPKLMSPKVLEEGYHYVLNELFSFESISKRLNGFWKSRKRKTRSITSSIKQKLYLLSHGLWDQDKENILFTLKGLFASEGKVPFADKFYALLVNLSIKDHVNDLSNKTL